MKLMRLLVVVLGAMLLVAGCSKKKEQAQQLEDKMLNQQTTRDTTADTMQAPAKVADTEEEANAGAVPQEEMSQASALPQAPAGNGYTVQVAGCEDRDYAVYLVGLYKERGYDPFVTQATIDGQRYYRVRVGNFDTFEQAQALQKELLSRFSVDGWIDRIGG